ncbi:MAG: hypothetical protein ABJB12_14790 [Pseudomonadota bacterium]
MPEGSDPDGRQRAIDSRSAPHLHGQLNIASGRPLVCAASLALAALSGGCDQGPRDDAPAHGPALHIVASYPVNGQGTRAAPGASLDCEPSPECPVPTNVSIELRFDRFLLPGGGLSAGLLLFTGNKANSIGLTPEYDLLERVLVYRTDRSLQPNTLYSLQIVPAASPPQGIWAFDGAPLVPGEVPLHMSFTTGDGPAPLPAPAPLNTDTCDTIVTGALASCASCHVTQPGDETVPPTKYPPMGLDLSTSRGLFYTAIDHVAHQTETGGTAANVGLETPLRFGVQMNVIDPGYPSTSYLMYKLLEKPENFRLDSSEPSCATGYHAPVSDGNCAPPSAAELSQLREWFVRGDPMPKNSRPFQDQMPFTAAISHSTLKRIAGWISAGAPCPEAR